MEKNQRDNGNQEPDKMSHLEIAQDGKKITETNPNNPVASQNNKQDDKQDQQGKESVEDKADNTIKSDSDENRQDNKTGK